MSDEEVGEVAEFTVEETVRIAERQIARWSEALAKLAAS